MVEIVRCRVFRDVPFTWGSALELAKTIECEQCGECCREHQVWLNDGEVSQIAAYLRRDKGAVKAMMKDGFLPVPCPFLLKNRCSIYSVRPVNCRIFPMNPCALSDDREVMLVWPCPAGKRLIKRLENDGAHIS